MEMQFMPQKSVIVVTCVCVRERERCKENLNLLQHLPVTI